MSRVEECDEETQLVWPLCVLYTDPYPPTSSSLETGNEMKRTACPQDMDEQEIIQHPKPHTMLSFAYITENISLIRRKISSESQLPTGQVNVICHSHLHYQNLWVVRI